MLYETSSLAIDVATIAGIAIGVTVFGVGYLFVFDWILGEIDSSHIVEEYEPTEPGDIYQVVYKKGGQTFHFGFYDHQRCEIMQRVMDYAANPECVLDWHDVAILRPKIKPWLNMVDRGDTFVEVDEEGGYCETDDDL